MRRVLIVLGLIVAGIVAFDFIAPHQAVRVATGLERGRSHLEEKRITIPGFEMAYLEGGEGENLLLIHGFGADKDNFTRVARWLTPHYHVVIPDLPGFGESARPDNVSYSIQEQVERVRAFARAVGLERFHMGGSSMGGHITLAYAAKYPAELQSVWLLDPGGIKSAYDSELRKRYLETKEILLLAKTPEEHARVREIAMAHQPFLPHSYKVVLGERAAANYALHAKIFAELNDHPYLLDDPMQHYEVPALIVWGKEDRVLNPKAADTLKGMFTQSQVVLMDGIGHLPMIEAPHRAAEDYLAFRAGLTSR
jgi:pimeloyl-ACP methyl ester carboxylesterase